MSTPEHNVEALWAYVHGESDAKTRESIESALETDTALSDAAQQIRTLHGHLKGGLSITSDEALCDEITAAWDLENAALHLSPEPRSDVQEHDQTRRGPRFTIWHSGLAIAACLLIMMGVQTLRPPAALTWNVPTLAKSRSDEGTSTLYSDFEIEEMHGLLVSEVGSAYDAADDTDGRRDAWILSTALNVRPDRSFTMSVKAHNRYENDLGYFWDYHYDGLDDYRARVKQLAGNVVDGLTISKP